jgi:hypothetical protein
VRGRGILGSSAILASFATIGADAPVGSVGKGGPTVSAEENKAMLRRLVDEGLNAGNMDVVDELFTPEVAARFKCTGTHRGEMMGIAPTGRHMEVDEVYFLRVQDGKFVEFWGLEDNLTRMRQLGLLPPRPVAVARMLAYYAKKLSARLRQRG